MLSSVYCSPHDAEQLQCRKTDTHDNLIVSIAPIEKSSWSSQIFIEGYAGENPWPIIIPRYRRWLSCIAPRRLSTACRVRRRYFRHATWCPLLAAVKAALHSKMKCANRSSTDLLRSGLAASQASSTRCRVTLRHPDVRSKAYRASNPLVNAIAAPLEAPEAIENVVATQPDFVDRVRNSSIPSAMTTMRSLDLKSRIEL